MSSTGAVGRSIAKGAVWMVAFKLAERSIGLVSTLILARLLIPADFGLVAMAMAIMAVLEVAGNFGFDNAIIRNPDARREHYDTAWSLTVVHGLLSALLLAALAVPLAHFFNQPRLEAVTYTLAFVAAVQGFQNIGMVMFRKELQFHQDVIFFLGRKVVAFAVTVWMAYTFRNYWALVGGTLVSRVAGVLISYAIHPYRPRLCFKATRELLGFSRWLVGNGLITYLSERGPDYLIGRFAGATSLGVFRIAHELSQLPTTELMYPIMRAAYPGYSKVAGEREKLKAMYLSVQAAILLLTLPAAVGLIVLAEPVVLLLLGPKWLDAIPVMRVLGVYGTTKVFQITNNAVFNVVGKPHLNMYLNLLETGIALPLLVLLLLTGQPLAQASLAYLAAQLVVVPLAMMLLARQLQLRAADRMRVTWRPLAGVTTLALALWSLLQSLGPMHGTHDAAMAMLVLVPVGALAYLGTVFVLWRLSGCPDGPERQFISFAMQRLSLGRASKTSAPTGPR